MTTHDAWPERVLNQQIIADIRDIDASLFQGADAVVALAAISNDPMGARFETVTAEINQDAIVHAAHLAAEAGVSRFVFGLQLFSLWLCRGRRTIRGCAP